MKSYDPSEGSLIVNGNIADQWESVKASRDEDGSTFQPSTVGGGTRTINANKAGKIMIVVKQSSPFNQILSDLANSQEIIPASFRDNSGADEFKAEAGYVVKHPDNERQKEIQDLEWVIQCEVLELNYGGNNEG